MIRQENINSILLSINPPLKVASYRIGKMPSGFPVELAAAVNLHEAAALTSVCVPKDLIFRGSRITSTTSRSTRPWLFPQRHILRLDQE